MRPTKEIALPSGQKIIIYTYLTAKEANEIKAVMMRAMKIDISDIKEGEKVPLKGQIDGTVLMEQEELLVKALVKEGQMSMYDLPHEDYFFLVEELNKIRKGNLAPAK